MKYVWCCEYCVVCLMVSPILTENTIEVWICTTARVCIISDTGIRPTEFFSVSMLKFNAEFKKFRFEPDSWAYRKLWAKIIRNCIFWLKFNF